MGDRRGAFVTLLTRKICDLSNLGGRLSGILDGGGGNNTLQVDPSLGITINDNGSITVGGSGSAGGSGGTFSGFQSVQVGTGSSSGGSTGSGSDGNTPATNTITLNASSNVALITGPNSGTVDGTGFTNISDSTLPPVMTTLFLPPQGLSRAASMVDPALQTASR